MYKSIGLLRWSFLQEKFVYIPIYSKKQSFTAVPYPPDTGCSFISYPTFQEVIQHLKDINPDS
jgi:hypothetical protein